MCTILESIVLDDVLCVCDDVGEVDSNHFGGPCLGCKHTQDTSTTTNIKHNFAWKRRKKGSDRSQKKKKEEEEEEEKERKGNERKGKEKEKENGERSTFEQVWVLQDGMHVAIGAHLIFKHLLMDAYNIEKEASIEKNEEKEKKKRKERKKKRRRK